MKTVAQCHLPKRPIAVGNRQLRRTTLLAIPRCIVPPHIATFPSLVGSFGSRLGVGSRQRRSATQRCASLRVNTHSTSTNTAHQPHSPSWAIRVVSHQSLAVTQRVVPLRGASHRIGSCHIATKYRYPASSAFGPSAVVSHQRCISAIGFNPHISAAQRTSAQRNEYPAKRWPSSGGLRFAGTIPLRAASLRAATPHCATPLASSQRTTKPSSNRIRAVIGGLVLLRCIYPQRFAARCVSPRHAAPRIISSQRLPACQAATAFGLSSVRKDYDALFGADSRLCAAHRTSQPINATAALRGGIPKVCIARFSGCRQWHQITLLGTALRLTTQLSSHQRKSTNTNH